MSSFSEKGNLMLFFLMAFGWSWSFWFLQMAGINLYVAPFGPFVAAFVMTYIREGKEGVKKILKRGFDPRIGKVWYIPVFLLWPLITGFSMLGVMLSGGVTPDLTVIYQPWLILSNFVYIFFLGGPIQEEFGWRGYALPRLLERYSALISSVVLGFIWAVWHLPLNFMYWFGPQYQLGISMFFSTIVLFVFVSILFTWLYNNTGGSVFAALIFHTMLNLSSYVLFPIFETESGPAFYFMSIIAVSSAVLGVFGWKNMVMKK